MSEATLMYNTKPSGLKRRVAFGLPISALLLGAIILLATFLRFYNLDAIGDGNTYYTAAVESMLQSWKNFFFVAAEPGGSVTVDKPPLGLWLQAISAAIFGVSGVSVALPQVLAGILAVPVIYHLVKRYAGEAAGLIAAFVLAVTPVAIAVERNNTMDATLLLTLLLAAWAFIKATDTGILRWLLAGAVLIGLGFNIKMMQAFLPVPAFYALYFLGAKQGWWRKIAHLALATLVMLAVSFSWAIAVDLTPADQRPYIGSSTDNTVMELIFGHNGFNRLLGGQRNRDGGTQPANSSPSQDGSAFAGNTPPAQPPPGGNAPGGGRPGGAAPGNDGQGGGGPGGGGPGGGSEIGDPGLLRLFTAPLSNEIGWLLPFGLLSIAIVAVSAPIQLPLNDTHKALILWGGWLLTAGTFFTVAEFFHAYYLVMLGAPLAALVGMGIMSLWRLRESRPVMAWLLIGTAAFGTILFQVYTIHQYIDAAWWVILVGLLAIAGLILLTVQLLFKEKLAASLAMGSLVASMLVTPLVWSALTTLNESPNIGLPSAYSGEQGGGRGGSGGRSDGMDVELLDYLQANTQDTEYLMAVKSSMQGSDYVIETGRPVLYMGGFNGGDPVVDAADLQQLVDDGRLRYILWSGDQGRGGDSDIGSWLESTCTPVTIGQSTGTAVQTINASTQNQDGPPGRQSGGRGGNTLYQCGG